MDTYVRMHDGDGIYGPHGYIGHSGPRTMRGWFFSTNPKDSIDDAIASLDYEEGFASGCQGKPLMSRSRAIKALREEWKKRNY
jgi:hypothetical protein